MNPRLFLSLHLAFFLNYSSADDNFFHLSGEYNTTRKIGRLSHNPFDVFNSTPNYEDQLANFTGPNLQLQKPKAIDSTHQATGEIKHYTEIIDFMQIYYQVPPT